MTNKEMSIKMLEEDLIDNNILLHEILSLYFQECTDKQKEKLNWCKQMNVLYCTREKCEECFNEWANKECITN